MNKMKFFKYLITFTLIGFLLYLFFKDINLKKVLEVFTSVNIIYPLIFLSGAVLQYFLRAYRWGIILGQHKKVSIKTTFNYTAISFLLNTFIPGKAGEAAKGIMLAQKENIKKGAGLASVVIERMIDLVIMVIMFDVSILLLGNLNSPMLMKLKSISLILLPLFLFVLFLFYLINIPLFFAFLDKLVKIILKISPKKFKDRLYRFAIDFIKSLKLKLSLKEYLKLIFSSVGIWIFIIPFYWILMKGFDFGVDISIPLMVPWFSIVVASAAIPTPGMAGSLEIGSKIAFVNVLNVGKGFENTIIAYTLIFHFLLILVSILVGLIAVKSEGLTMKSLKNIKAE